MEYRHHNHSMVSRTFGRHSPLLPALLGFIMLIALAPNLAGAFTLPANTLHWLNISIQNAQTVATGNGLQVMISFNASHYSAYEASNLQNIEFSYNNGTIAEYCKALNGIITCR